MHCGWSPIWYSNDRAREPLGDAKRRQCKQRREFSVLLPSWNVLVSILTMPWKMTQGISHSKKHPPIQTPRPTVRSHSLPMQTDVSIEDIKTKRIHSLLSINFQAGKPQAPSKGEEICYTSRFLSPVVAKTSRRTRHNTVKSHYLRKYYKKPYQFLKDKTKQLIYISDWHDT